MLYDQVQNKQVMNQLDAKLQTLLCGHLEPNIVGQVLVK